MLNGYKDPTNDTLASIFNIIANGLGTLFGGTVTIKDLYSSGKNLELQREMLLIPVKGPAVVTIELYNELFS